MKTVAITGASGFVGTHLKKRCEKNGYKVISIKRQELSNEQRLLEIMESSDWIINLAGANIINRWTQAYKKILYSSRIETTQALIHAMKRATNKPALFISTSAVGIYSNQACYDEEQYLYDDAFLATVCKDWEKEARKAQELNVRTAIFRFGIVLGQGGALQKMLTPFKLGLGGIIGDGKQYFSFIHIEDLLNAYEYVEKNSELEGIFNLTAPESTTNYGLTKALGEVLHRPTILPLPQWILKLIFSEGATVLTDGQCAKPKRLLDSGFVFRFSSIKETLGDLIK